MIPNNRHSTQRIRKSEARVVRMEPGRWVSQPTLAKIPFFLAGAVEFIDPACILYAQADSNYTILYLSDEREKIIISKTLKQIVAKLPACFTRIHQSYLVNIKFLRTYEKAKCRLVLDGGKQLPVSRSGKEELNKMLQRHSF